MTFSLALRRVGWLVAFSLVAVASGWPQARSAEKAPVFAPDRNPVNLRDKFTLTEFSAEEGSEKNLLWKAKLGDHAYAGPVVVDGKVLVCTNNQSPRDPKITDDKGIVMCFRAADGAFLWQAVHDKLGDSDRDYEKQGVASTPVVHAGLAYYVSNRAEVVCLDMKGDPNKPGKARIVWTYDMIGQLKIVPCFLANSSPLIVDDLVFVVTGNGVDGKGEVAAPDAPSFIALDRKTGKLVWKDASPGKNIMEGQWTGPVFANPKGGKPQVIFPGGDGWLYSFEPTTGKLIWKFNCNPSTAVWNPKQKLRSEKSYFLANPVVYEDRVYIGVGQNPDNGPGVGHLWCIDTTKTGDVSPKNDNFDPKAPVNKDSALVWHFGGKIVPRPKTDRDVHFGRTLSTCCIVDGLLYVADLDGFFYCVDARTGKKLWEHDMKAECWASPYYVDGKVYLGNNDGELYAFTHGRNHKAPARYSFEGRIQSPVCSAGGVLFVQSSTYLYAIGKK